MGKGGSNTLWRFPFESLWAKAAIGKYAGCWKVQGYCGGNNCQDDSHRPTTLLLDELLIKPREHKARQWILFHQGMDSFLGHIKAAWGRFLQVLHCDVLREMINIHLWDRKQGHWGRQVVGFEEGLGEKWNFSPV